MQTAVAVQATSSVDRFPNTFGSELVLHHSLKQLANLKSNAPISRLSPRGKSSAEFL